jgi:hypothetical protein
VPAADIGVAREFRHRAAMLLALAVIELDIVTHYAQPSLQAAACQAVTDTRLLMK